MQTISKKTRSDVLLHNDIPVLTYTINYPYFTTTCNQTAAQTINQYYEILSQQEEDYCRNVLYPQAVEDAMYAKRNQFPFHTYEFLTDYVITYNEDCITSLYSDHYTYLGGAHGNTHRLSQTWNFETGKQLSLLDFYPAIQNLNDSIFDTIQPKISQRLEENPSSYFDNYPQLIRGNFDINSFYLKSCGIVIYYQQYDIAPYATGIPQFFIPFEGCDEDEDSVLFST